MNAVQDRGIPRIAIRDEWTRFEPLRGKLFEDCAKKLGYRVSEVTATESNSAVLSKIMKDSGVEPLSRKAVEKYRVAEERRANKIWLRLFAHVSLAVIANGLWIYFMAFPHVSDWLLLLFPGFVGNVLLVAVGGGFAIWSPGGEWKWRSTDLKGYTKPVPEFALAFALAINKVNPNVTFQVEELTYQDRVADPFLLAKFGDRMYYIAVWNEPSFEGRAVK